MATQAWTMAPKLKLQDVFALPPLLLVGQKHMATQAWTMAPKLKIQTSSSYSYYFFFAG